MKDIKTIRFLKEDDFRHLRVIRCRGKEFNRYSLFLFYLRDFDYEELDELDNSILDSLNQTQEAALEINQKILFEGQLDEIISRYKLEEEKKITIQLSPIVTNELIDQVKRGKEVYSYLKHFNAQFRKGYDFMHLNNHFICYLENEKLKSLTDTVQGI